MNVRKLIVCLGALLFVMNANADWQGNALVGISGEYARYNGAYDIGVYYTGLPALAKTDYQDNQRNSGFGGGVLLGYQFSCNAWIIGAEFSADWLDVSKGRTFVFADQNNLISWNTRLQMRNNGLYGLSARIGYEMAPFFLSYVRLGLEAVHQTFSAHLQGAPNAYPFGMSFHDDIWRNDVYVGVGAEFSMPSSYHVRLRMEYNYHFPSGYLQDGGRILDGVVNPAFALGARPALDTGKVSLVWNF